MGASSEGVKDLLKAQEIVFGILRPHVILVTIAWFHLSPTYSQTKDCIACAGSSTMLVQFNVNA